MLISAIVGFRSQERVDQINKVVAGENDGIFYCKVNLDTKSDRCVIWRGCVEIWSKEKKERSVITKIKKNTAKFEVYRLSWGGGGVQKIEGDWSAYLSNCQFSIIRGCIYSTEERRVLRFMVRLPMNNKPGETFRVLVWYSWNCRNK